MRQVLTILFLSSLLAGAVLFGPGYLLDQPSPVPPPSDVIVVISGDEQMARFREGLRLFQSGYGELLVFSGAARDGGTSNAEVMRDMAVQAGIPASAIIEEPRGQDTWGNAVETRAQLEGRGMSSGILVTSPYHVRRAKLTFEAAFQGSGMHWYVQSAPDSEWRKLTWWQESETRRLTISELEKLAFIALTGRYRQ